MEQEAEAGRRRLAVGVVVVAVLLGHKKKGQGLQGRRKDRRSRVLEQRQSLQ